MRVSGQILGENHFIERVLTQAEEHPEKRMILDDIVAAVYSIFDMHEDELAAPGRTRIPSRIRGVIGLLVQDMGNGFTYHRGRAVWP